MNIEFNSNLLNNINKDSPIIVDSFSKTLDSQMTKIRNQLTPRRTVSEGYLSNLLLAKNNMTQTGMVSAGRAFTDKLKAMMPAYCEECDEITRLLQTSGFIVRDENIPHEYYKLLFFGNSDKNVPTYIGLLLPVQFKLDNKLLMKTENFTEKEVIDHFNDVKAYWSILESGGTGIIELVKKINDDEDSFFAKARDFNSIMSGKLFNRPYNTVSLALTSKSAKNIKYFSDPWLGFCVEMETMRIKNNAPHFMVKFELASFSNLKEVQNKMATYYASIVLFYKVEKPLLGSFKFERNGVIY